ncbi:DDE_3 domain-containing protein [Trichonephila clavipes]|nr:DDE_3 domain-containing protein [Trichonephila clavipes]
MVWAGIMINGGTRLHGVANGTMTGQRYIDEALLPHVRLFRGAVGDKFIFMDENATCHRTLAVQDCLDSEGIQRLVWPARSLDLNTIENVWDALGKQAAGRNYPPTNKNTLIRALTEEWDKLPQQLLDNGVQSMNHDSRIRVRRFSDEPCLLECIIERRIVAKPPDIWFGVRFRIIDDLSFYEFRGLESQYVDCRVHVLCNLRRNENGKTIKKADIISLPIAINVRLNITPQFKLCVFIHGDSLPNRQIYKVGLQRRLGIT